MAKPNFQFEKRKKELDKKAKKEEKLRRKQERAPSQDDATAPAAAPDQPVADGEKSGDEAQ